MPERFQNKYRTDSHRLRGWDYAADGLYFLTVVTYGRDCVFGKVIKGQMILNEYGKIAHSEWFKSFKMRNELFLDEFILMPNHWHAIVGIDTRGNIIDNNIGDGDDGGNDTDGGGRVEMHDRASLTPNTNKSNISFYNAHHHIKPEFKRRPKSISSFVAGYKSAVISKIDDYIEANGIQKRKYNRNNPLWQSNFHDHIIRNGKEYWTIKNYIKHNPSNWGNDKFYN